jgi:hypothetical protein
VAQADHAEVLAQLSVQAAGVADDEPGQQPPLGGGQRVDRPAQSRTQVTGHPLHPRRR